MRALRRSCIAATLAALGHAASAAPVPADVILQPGLYRVDMDTHFDVNEGHREHPKTRLTIDGATGTETRRDGKDRVVAQFSTGKPQTLCVPRGKPTAAVLLPGTCRAGAPQVQGGAAVFHADCGYAEYTMTMRRIDPRTWAIDTHYIRKAAPVGSAVEGTISAMRAGLEAQARNGTPQEKAEARRLLAEFEQTAAQMRRDAAEEEANMPAARAALAEAVARGERDANDDKVADIVTKQRFTRIGDSCNAR